MKKLLAYLFLITVVGVVVYFGYDTYKVVTGSSDNDETQEEEKIPENTIKLKYLEYSLDKSLKYSLARFDGAKLNIYLYDKEVSCLTEGVFEASNPNLVFMVNTNAEGDRTKVSTTTLYKHNQNAPDLKITGIPDTKNVLSVTQEQDKLKGTMELVWKNNRSVKGEFDATLCQ